MFVILFELPIGQAQSRARETAYMETNRQTNRETHTYYFMT